MLQARIKGQSEWYRPERDIANSFPAWIRKALDQLQLDGLTEEQQVDLNRVAKGMGMITRACIEGRATEEDIKKYFEDLRTTTLTEAAVGLLSVVIRELFLVYLSGLKDVRPQAKENTDGSERASVRTGESDGEGGAADKAGLPA